VSVVFEVCAVGVATEDEPAAGRSRCSRRQGRGCGRDVDRRPAWIGGARSDRVRQSRVTTSVRVRRLIVDRAAARAGRRRPSRPGRPSARRRARCCHDPVELLRAAWPLDVRSTIRYCRPEPDGGDVDAFGGEGVRSDRAGGEPTVTSSGVPPAFVASWNVLPVWLRTLVHRAVHKTGERRFARADSVWMRASRRPPCCHG